MASITTLNDLIEKLHQLFEDDVVDVDHVMQVFNSYKSNPAEWKKFAKFDRYRYTRNLVDEGNGKFNLMLLCWGEGHMSSIHDHADAHCFMKMLDGTLREVRFAWPEENAQSEEISEMKTVGEHALETNQVSYMSDSLGLHRVENPSHVDRSVSLHLYSPPFESCQVFDQRTGKKAAAKVTFWSKFGERLPTAIVSKSCTLPENSSKSTDSTSVS